MVVSERYRFIFLRTEKTAGTSLTAALADALGPDDFIADRSRPAWARYSPIQYGALMRTLPKLFGLHPHATARQARSVLGRKTFNAHFKFAIERNPWDRQISLHAHREIKKGKDPEPFDRNMRSVIYRLTEYCRMDNWSIYAIGDTIAVDRVLRYERLDEDLTQLFAELGVETSSDLPRLREYRTGRWHYSTYYSNTTRDLVAHWYRREIDALGYTFEDRRSRGEARPGASALM